MGDNKVKFENSLLIPTGDITQKQICKQFLPVTLTFDLLRAKKSIKVFSELSVIQSWSQNATDQSKQELLSVNKFVSRPARVTLTVDLLTPKSIEGLPRVMRDMLYIQFDYNSSIQKIKITMGKQICGDT